MVVLVAVAALAAGCQEKYQRGPVGLDSPQGRKVAAMIEAFRQAPAAQREAVAGRDSARGTDEQRRGIYLALEPVATASKVELIAVDSFGPEIYRASIRLDIKGGQAMLYMLLVTDGEEMKWAGRN